MSHKPYNLFLDDLRSPLDAFEQEKHEMFSKKEWVVVRNYDEFVSYIHNNGLPQLVAFDHDLHEEHYTPKEYWLDYEKSMIYQDAKAEKYTFKTGLDCAHFLIDYCEEYQKPLPEYYSHSANPIGRDRINDILHYYKRYSGQSVQTYTTNKTLLQKVLMHRGQYVDIALLFKGIYARQTPILLSYDETIEKIISDTHDRLKTFNREVTIESFKENILQCQLVEVEISHKF